jgi:tryptophan halogenase
MRIPPRLQEKMDIFMNNGRTFRESDELFNDTSWFAVLIGQLGRPHGYDPVAEMMSVEEIQNRLTQIRETITNSVDYMPKHNQFILENCAA